MKNQKVDLRVYKTKRLIKESFIELVEQKGFKNVTVTEIVKKANINRNTFYLHYQDIQDLADKLIKEASSKMYEKLNNKSFLMNTSLDQIKEIQIRWGFRIILNEMSKELDYYRIVLLDESLNGYILKVYAMIKKALTSLLNVKNPRSNLIFEYTFNGMIGLIQQWIIYSPVSESDTAKILAKLAYSNLQEFKEINIKN